MQKWVKRLAVLLLSVMALAGFVYMYLEPAKPPASQAFINAQVITMDANNSLAEAVYIEGERIIAVGSRAEIEHLITPTTLIHDLHGKTLVPGFVDAHSHFPGSGMSLFMADLRSPPVGNITSVVTLLAALKTRASATPKGEWVNGFGYDNLMLTERRHPSIAELDAAVPDHPVFIMHVSGHLAVANSAALAAVDISAKTPDPAGGHYGRDDEGSLTGLLEENAATALQRKTFDIGVLGFLQMTRQATEEYLHAGVTTAQSGTVSREFTQGLGFAKQLNLVPMRLELWPKFDEFGLDLLEGVDDPQNYNTDTLHIGAVKIVADGSIQGFTGYLSQPYHTPFGDDHTYRGYPRMPFTELAAWIARYHAAGYQLAIHGNGDAAIEDIINAFEMAQKATPRADPRMILIHAQMLRDDQLDRLTALGITPSFFSAHTYYWGDQHRDVTMGPDRAANISPAQSALQRHVRFSSHLDTPIVPMSPLLSVWSCVTRLSASGNIIGPAQRIDVLSALRSVTIDAAWQIFRDKDLGSIEPGKLADLVVLDQDPLGDPLAIKDIPVNLTMIGGVSHYQRHAD
jgi:predicted amidohydrolase YtcJ